MQYNATGVRRTKMNGLTPNIVNTVLSINGDSGHVIEGCGQATICDVLNHYPLVRRGRVNIVKLQGFMINDVFHSFNVEEYAFKKMQRHN